MSKLLSRKLAVTLGSIVTIIMGIDDHVKAAIVGLVAVAYVIGQALVDKETEKVVGAIEEGIKIGREKAAATSERVKIVPPGMLALCLVLGLSVVGCGGGVKSVVWPTIAKCTPAPADVMTDVLAALKNDGGGSLSERALKLLEDLARKHGAAAIVCAANDIADRLAADGDPEGARVANKAREFVKRTETRVEE
jgi:hypothetical protein